MARSDFLLSLGRDFNLPVEKNWQGRISGRSGKA
jgi:hypothetical protein